MRSLLTPRNAILAALVVAGVVALGISRTIPFDSDEANHANLAVRQYQDLAAGRFADFARHSYRTGQFPFFHAWTILPAYALLGVTEFASRLPQCLHFVLGAAATAIAAWRVCGESRRAGGLAGALFACSPLLAVLSGLCMLETPGAAMTAVALACFAESLRHDGRAAFRWDAATAVAVLATWFTKLNYGMWVLPAIGLGYLVHATHAGTRRRALVGVATYVGVLVLALGIWYSTPSQRAAFHGFLTNPAQKVSVVHDDPSFRLPGFRTENFTGYFPLVAGQFHLHWTIGAAVLALAVGGAVRGIAERNAGIVAAAACAGWTWISLSMGFREYALDRFIAPALPAIWITAAAGAQPFLDRGTRGKLRAAAESLLLAAGLAAQVIVVRTRLPLEYEVGTEFRPVYDHVLRTVPGPASVILLNCTDHVSPRTLLFELSRQPGRTYTEFDVKDGSGERIYESTRNLDVWTSDPRPWGDASWTSWVVELVPGPRYPDAVVRETIAMWSRAVAAHVATGRFRLADERRFDDLDLTVRVWQDRSPPPHVGLRGARD